MGAVLVNQGLPEAFSWWGRQWRMRGNGRFQDGVRKMIHSRLWILYCVYVASGSTLNALVKGSPMRILSAIDTAVASWGCVAMTVYMRRTGEGLSDLLADAAALAADICAGGVPPELQVLAEQHYKRGRLLFNVGCAYPFGISVVSVLPTIAGFDAGLAVWPWFSGQLGRVTNALFWMFTCFPLGLPVFIVYCFLLFLVEANTLLYRILGAQLDRANANTDVKEAARRHVQLCKLTDQCRDVLEYPLNVYVSTSLAMPAIATVTLTRASATGFAVVGMLYLAFFYAMCLVGERLQRASTSLVPCSFESYASQIGRPHSTSRARADRLLLTIMLRAHQPDTIFAFRKAVGLNLHMFTNSINNWYSALNILLKMP
ncbi:Ribosomal protein S12 methylthiotransferase [Frankliniella fusca]|uniref:Ribosomal protein S12 methylthiotransferase n=1 Tax=Frankliniella fusca TaxID=407009 RepID=A0AAE1HY61_9NEOP|nr:Ribosomal protein S12 methylthiotransferase [Frankliniella fusca]